MTKRRNVDDGGSLPRKFDSARTKCSRNWTSFLEEDVHESRLIAHSEALVIHGRYDKNWRVLPTVMNHVGERQRKGSKEIQLHQTG
jgi:hypothetical protein